MNEEAVKTQVAARMKEGGGKSVTNCGVYGAPVKACMSHNSLKEKI